MTEENHNAETKRSIKLGPAYGWGLLVTLAVVIAAIVFFAYGAAPQA